MKNIALAALLAAFLGISSRAAELPRQAPDLSIVLPDGKQVKPSDYRGKVVALTFFLTTCPHCQKALQILSGVQKDLGPKGLQVLAGALNESDSPGAVKEFIARFHPDFPTGAVDRMNAAAYMQLSPTVRAFVPFMIFIDRKGMIQAQYTGGDDFLKNEDTEAKNIRDEVTKLLAESKITKAPLKSQGKPAARK